MNKEEFRFLSKDGRTQVHAVKWLPDSGKYKAILQITHGMIEFIERYEPFAEYLTEHEFMVVGHDHIGHGESVSSKEDWGYFAPENPSDILIEDMHQLRTMVQKENPTVPYFMLGHSMGSYMLRKYLAFHNDNLRGAIIMGTGFVPEGTTKLGMFCSKVIAGFKGWHHRSKFIENSSFGKPYQKYDMTGATLDNSWLTKDESIVDFYYHEPKCTFKFTLNGYMGLFEAVLFDCRQENVDKLPKKLPIFIVSGKDDPVGDCGEGVMKVYDMFNTAGILDLTYKLYENDRHEILNETDKEIVFSDILSWMNVRIDT